MERVRDNFLNLFKVTREESATEHARMATGGRIAKFNVCVTTKLVAILLMASARVQLVGKGSLVNLRAATTSSVPDARVLANVKMVQSVTGESLLLFSFSCLRLGDYKYIDSSTDAIYRQGNTNNFRQNP